MKSDLLKRHYIDAMVKHLPPSASTLRLVDIDQQSGTMLVERREDLEVIPLSADKPVFWDVAADTIDAVVAYNNDLTSTLLEHVLEIMRAGGRFIVVLSQGHVDESYVQLLEKYGYTRILVEPAVDDLGVLIRGEKPHLTADTTARIQQVATKDGDLLDSSVFAGRYIHLLIRQTPNKPVWRLEQGEALQWQAVAIVRDNIPLLLGFSSLPKAVGFMQPAVVEGVITDINKVGKFSKMTAAGWEMRVLLNPTLESIAGQSLLLLDIDPDTAEVPDE